MNEKRISVRFDLDDETDRDVWEYLCGVPHGSRQNAVKVALIKAMRDHYDKKELAALITQAVKEALPGMEAAHVSNAEIPNDVMDFLSAL